MYVVTLINFRSEQTIFVRDDASHGPSAVIRPTSKLSLAPGSGWFVTLPGESDHWGLATRMAWPGVRSAGVTMYPAVLSMDPER